MLIDKNKQKDQVSLQKEAACRRKIFSQINLSRYGDSLTEKNNQVEQIAW